MKVEFKTKGSNNMITVSKGWFGGYVQIKNEEISRRKVKKIIKNYINYLLGMSYTKDSHVKTYNEVLNGCSRELIFNREFLSIGCQTFTHEDILKILSILK